MIIIIYLNWDIHIIFSFSFVYFFAFLSFSLNLRRNSSCIAFLRSALSRAILSLSLNFFIFLSNGDSILFGLFFLNFFFFFFGLDVVGVVNSFNKFSNLDISLYNSGLGLFSYFAFFFLIFFSFF